MDLIVLNTNLDAVSIVDVYDALVSKRVYKEAFTHDLAIQMIRNGECGKFSPRLMECLELAKEDFFCVTELLENCSFI